MSFPCPRRRRRSLGLPVLALVVTALLAQACGGSSSSGGGSGSSGSTGKDLKVAWAYYGPIDDGGWNHANAVAEPVITDALGSSVQQAHTDNVSYDSKATQIFQQYAAQGYNVLIDPTSFGTLFTNVCKKDPNLTCLEVSPQGAEPSNVLGWAPAYWVADYIAGVAAGLMTKTGTLGYILPYKTPLGISPLNSFALGCQSVHKGCTVKVVVVNDYFNPPVTTRAANTLIDAGADVIRGWNNDPSWCNAAQSRGKMAVGTWSDASSQCPNAIITSTVHNFSKFYLDQVKKIQDGTWTQQDRVILDPEEYLTLGKWGASVPPDVQSQVEDVYNKVVSGEMNPWVGPIDDQSGKERVPAGQTMDEAFLYNGWNWFVKGVVTSG